MGQFEKSTRSNLRQVSVIGEELLGIIHQDMVKLETELRTSLKERIRNMEDQMLDLAKTRDAIAAGLKECKKDMAKLHKRIAKEKADEKTKNAVLSIAKQLGETRQMYMDLRTRLEKYLHLPPTSIELVNGALQDINIAAGKWEAKSRDIENGFSNAVDYNMPSEISTIEKEVMENGYSVLLAGESRDSTSIQAFNDELVSLMNP